MRSCRAGQATWRTGNTFPLAVYSTSRGVPSGPTSRSVPSCSPCSRKARQSCETCGLKPGGAKSSIWRPMIFSLGSPKQLSPRRRWRLWNCRRRRRSGWARKGDRQSPGRAAPVLSDRSLQANRRLMAVSRRNPSRSHLSGVEPVDQCRLRDKIGPRRDYTARTIGRREPQPACILPPALSSPRLPNVIGGRDRSPVYGRDLCPTCDCGGFGHDRRPNIRQNSAVHRGEAPPSVSRYMPDASSNRHATYIGCPKGTSSRRSMSNPHPDSGAVP